MTITLYNHLYHYTVKYTKRKTIGLTIKEPFHLQVHMPLTHKHVAIEPLLLEKQDWIHRKTIDLEKRLKAMPLRQCRYVDGETYYYFGNPLVLKIEVVPHAKKAVVTVENGYLLVKAPSADAEVIQKALVQFYKQASEDFARPLIGRYSQALGVRVNRVVFKNQETRWGSCSSKGNINLNLRLSMMPTAIFQYIIVHEMAHRIHLNHSKAFWQLVSHMCSDYKALQEWLKSNGPLFILN